MSVVVGDAVEDGEELGSLDAEDLLSPLDVECGQAEIAVVLKAAMDDSLEVCIDEELLPLKQRGIGGLCGRPSGWVVWPVIGDWGLGARILRGQVAGCRSEGQEDEREEGAVVHIRESRKQWAGWY